MALYCISMAVCKVIESHQSVYIVCSTYQNAVDWILKDIWDAYQVTALEVLQIVIISVTIYS